MDEIDKKNFAHVNEFFLVQMQSIWNKPYGIKENEVLPRLFEYSKALAAFKAESLQKGLEDLRDNAAKPFTSWPPIGDCVQACRHAKTRGSEAQKYANIDSMKARFDYVDKRKKSLADKYIAAFPEICAAWDNPYNDIKSVALEAAHSGAQREYLLDNGLAQPMERKYGRDWIKLAFLRTVGKSRMAKTAAAMANQEILRLTGGVGV